jgi:hypothetical protein
MSAHRTTVVARWPHTPLGTRVEIEIPDSTDVAGVAYEVNEVVGELWKGTPTARLVRAFAAFLSQPVIVIKAVITRG